MRKEITSPLDAARARSLRAGDEVVLRGRIVTARERAQRHLLRHDDRHARELLRGSLVFHCAPVMARDPRTGEWQVLAASPSPSMAVEPFQARLIARYGVAGAVGRGGMGGGTLGALRAHGAVYLHTVSGLAVALARCVRRVEEVHLLDRLGGADALWVLSVEDFPAVVTMDAHGDSLHRGQRDPHATTGAPGR